MKNYDQIRKELINKVLVFLPSVEDGEQNYFTGQKVRVIEVIDDSVDNTPQGSCYIVKVDFSEFEDHNKALAKPVYINEYGVHCLKWHETNFYPSDCKAKVRIGCDQ